MHWKKSKTRAFTLAEILLTLAIIGAVASITIPSINQDINNKTIITKVKQVYATLSQATMNMKLECGNNLDVCISNIHSADNDNVSQGEVYQLYLTKLLTAKACDDDSGCFPDEIYKYLNGNNFTRLGNSGLCKNFVLNSGTSVCVDWNGWQGNIYYLFVDVNMSKPPNKLGRDLFAFYYNEQRGVLLPAANNDCNISGLGFGCTKRILIEEAINY